MATKIQFRRDTSTNWSNSNPTLSQGEPGFDLDRGLIKVGNGTDTWNCLGFQGTGVTGNGSVAIGNSAGDSCQGTEAVAIGEQAGQCCQEQYAIAIGREAGECCQGQYSVAIGYRAGNCDQGQGPWSTGYAVAIGAYAAECCQQYYAVAIGYEAGRNCQEFSAVAVGRNAGRCSQNNGAVAVGKQAGQSCQGQGAVSIGNMSGRYSQGNYSVAIGYEAAYGCCCSQGEYAVAIGAYAGYDNQSSYSIIINAQDANLNADNSGFFVSPIRELNGCCGINDSSKELRSVFYDPDTKEVFRAAQMPQNLQSETGDYTIVISDASKHIYKTGTGNVYVNTDANVAMPIGSVITLVTSANSTTIQPVNSGVTTLVLSKFGADTSINVPSDTYVTMLKIENDKWMIQT
jgi:hypothetical protein